MKAVTLFSFIPFFLCLSLSLSFDSVAATPSYEPKVKLSSSGICHDQGSVSFGRTKNFQAFDSIASCIEQGGRLPKGKTKQIEQATNEATAEGRAYTTLYNRDDWPHWLDSDNDCQNTRHEMLIQASTKAVTFKSEKQCNVLFGEWYDPYSNETFTTSKDLDLDHIVPLKFAHGHGASRWSREQKALFANDRDNLILAQASLNRQKGAKGVSDWLPPNHQYRCAYIAQFNRVMKKYDLAYAPSEKRIAARLVNACSKTIDNQDYSETLTVD